MRRAVLLTQHLRAGRVTTEDLPAKLQNADLRDPFTLRAFEWDEDRHAIVFDSHGDHRWHRNEYFY